MDKWWARHGQNKHGKEATWGWQTDKERGVRRDAMLLVSSLQTPNRPKHWTNKATRRDLKALKQAPWPRQADSNHAGCAS
jgi:hypothetical protein